MDKIAYLPLDLPKFDLMHVVQKYKFQDHNKWPHAWNCLPVCGKTDTWDADSFYEAFLNKYEDGEVSWNVPELKDALSYYPGEIVFSQILNQKTNIPAHRDYPITYKQPEPSGFKILLNNELEKSFFVKINGKRHFIELPKDTSCFIINDHEVLHGSLMPKCEKYIVSCFGVLNTDEHEELLNRSLAKYGDKYGIFF